MSKKNARKRAPRRSAEWFGKTDKDGFHHRSWMKNQGLPHHLFDGRPVIGICNTWSELTPCNAHFRVLAERVKRGVYEMGGFPLEFPVMSLGETLMRQPGGGILASPFGFGGQTLYRQCVLGFNQMNACFGRVNGRGPTSQDFANKGTRAAISA